MEILAKEIVEKPLTRYDKTSFSIFMWQIEEKGQKMELLKIVKKDTTSSIPRLRYMKI